MMMALETIKIKKLDCLGEFVPNGMKTIQVHTEFSPEKSQPGQYDIFMATSTLPDQDDEKMENELFWQGSTVIWSVGDYVKQCMTDPEGKKVIKALFAQFKPCNDKLNPTLCIGMETGLKLLLEDGSFYSINLGFDLDDIFPIKNGVLLQSSFSSFDEEDEDHFLSGDIDVDTRSRIYTIQDPLAAPKALTKVQSPSGFSDESKSSMTFGLEYRIAAVSQSADVMCVYDSLKNEFSIWIIHSTTMDNDCIHEAIEYCSVPSSLKSEDLKVFFVDKTNDIVQIAFWDRVERYIQVFEIEDHSAKLVLEEKAFGAGAVTAVSGFSKNLLLLTSDSKLKIWLDKSVWIYCDISSIKNSISQNKEVSMHATKRLRGKYHYEFSRNETSKSVSNLRVNGIKDFSGCNVSFIMSDGKLYRFSCDFRPKLWLVSKTFDILRYFFDEESYLSFYAHWISICCSFTANSPWNEWTSLCSLMRAIFRVFIPEKSYELSDFEFMLNDNDDYGMLNSEQIEFNLSTEQKAFVFISLHYLYEELKLLSCRCKEMSKLAHLLFEISQVHGLSWSYYYKKDFPSLETSAQVSQFSCLNTFNELEPPSIIGLLSSILEHNTVNDYVPLFNEHLSYIMKEWMSPRVIELYRIYSQENYEFSKSNSGIRITKSQLKLLSPIVAFPINCLIQKARHASTTCWSAAEYELLDRLDILVLKGLSDYSHFEKSKYGDRSDKADQSNLAEIFDSELKLDSATQSFSRYNYDEPFVSKLIWPHDRRFSEARKILKRTHPVKIVIPEEMKQTDYFDINTLIQYYLARASVRTLASAVGRGMIDFCSRNPSLSTPWTIESANLSGKLPENKGEIQISPENIIIGSDWVLFNEGVAAGLQIKDSPVIDSSWIVFNRGDEPDCKHSGFLLAMGLLGHLKKMTSLDAFEYLNVKDDMTSIGLILGLAASYMGSMEPKVNRLISLHIPAMLPHSSYLNVSQNLESIGLISLGLLFMQSGNKQISDFLLKEIGRKDHSSMENCSLFRENYALCAGFALGFINAGNGGVGFMGDQRRALDLLCSNIYGYNIHEIHDFTAKAPGTDCCEITGPCIDVTSIPSLISIGMIYMKTNSEVVATKIKVPDSLAELLILRPIILKYMAICYNLIMWDDISLAEEWFEKQFTQPFLNHFKSNINDVYLNEIYLSIYSASCFLIGLKFGGSLDISARNFLLGKLRYLYSKRFTKLRTPHLRKLITQANSTIAISLGMVMAGSGDLEVFKELRKIHAQNLALTYGEHQANQMAMGFLFLSGGRKTLSNSTQSVSLLLCACFPQFPASLSDESLHFQALRNLYVLAIESRCIATYDVHTNKPISIPLTIHFQDGKKEAIECTTPCLIPRFEDVELILLRGKDFHDLDLDVKNSHFIRDWISQGKEIPVQRKNYRKSNLKILENIRFNDPETGFDGLLNIILKHPEWQENEDVILYIMDVLTMKLRKEETVNFQLIKLFHIASKNYPIIMALFDQKLLKLRYNGE